ncbi:MAG: hypothetical protein AB1631_21000 [Acidobacteriota bacterium]
MRNLFRSMMMICLLLLEAAAQDPLKVAPRAYKLAFENEWVRVTRVHYGPREKIAEHFHTPRSSAYVYLNDGGPVIFKHINLPYGDVTRPETKAGSFRVYKGIKEVHAVENTSDRPSDFLRVEFKTEVVNEKSLRGKFYREPYPAGENFSKVQFENEQIRITRIVIAERKKMDVSTNASEPALIVALTDARLKASVAKSRARSFSLEMGKTRWLGINQREELENIGDAPAEMLRFEFKTKPFDDPNEWPKAHDHKHN